MRAIAALAPPTYARRGAAPPKHNTKHATAIEPIVFLAVVAALAVYAVVVHNRLGTFRNRVKNGFAQIDVRRQPRYDLIPNLVETAKRYMRHERETLATVIGARNQAKAAEERAANRP